MCLVAQASITEKAEAILEKSQALLRKKTKKATHLRASLLDLLHGFIIEVLPVRNLDLSSESWVNRLHGDLSEGRVDI